MVNFLKTAHGIALVCLCFLLSACAPSHRATPRNTLLTIPPLATDTETATDTPPTVPPSATPLPTYTPRPSRTPIPTDPKAEHATQTEEALATQSAVFTIACGDPGYEFLSPKANWLAVPCGSSRDDQTLEITSRTGERWVFAAKDFGGSLVPLHWLNEDYFFFAVDTSKDGGGTCVYGLGVNTLIRVNLQDGSLSRIISYYGDGGLHVAFSPTGSWLAYYIQQGNPVLFNLQSGEKITLEGSYTGSGNLTWSPDGSKLAYVTCQSPDHLSITESTIKIFTLETRQLKTILALNQHYLSIEANDERSILIYDYDTNLRRENRIIYNWDSDKMITATPLPTP